MAAPEPNPAAAIDAASDRAALLRYVLDHVLERCALPDGVSNAAHLDLDRVDVPALLASLREPGGRPDLRAATGAPAGAPPRGCTRRPRPGRTTMPISPRW